MQVPHWILRTLQRARLIFGGKVDVGNGTHLFPLMASVNTV